MLKWEASYVPQPNVYEAFFQANFFSDYLLKAMSEVNLISPYQITVLKNLEPNMKFRAIYAYVWLEIVRPYLLPVTKMDLIFYQKSQKV